MVDAYGTDDGFKIYHTARGRDVSQYDAARIAQQRLVASEWLDNTYRASFPGVKVAQRAQVREWPRNAAFDYYGYNIPSTSVPTEVENATYELALKTLGGATLAVDYTPPKYKHASVDGAVSVEYVTGLGASDVQTQYAVVDQMLSGILGGGSGSYAPYSGFTARV